MHFAGSADAAGAPFVASCARSGIPRTHVFGISTSAGIDHASPCRAPPRC